MGAVWTIAARELKSLFLSPLAWTVLGVVQLILAYLFLAQLDSYMQFAAQLALLESAPGVTDIVVAPVIGDAAVVLLLASPLVTMRLLAEERRARTLPLLYTAPVSMTEIVAGKYLGVMGFMLVLVGLIALMPLSLLAGGSLDLGKLAAGLLGLTLVLGAFAAAGLFMSSLTAQPVVAAVSTFGLLLLVWIIDWAGASREGLGDALARLSLLRHYENLVKGIVSTADLAYYLLFILFFLGLAVRRLDAERMGG